MVITRNRKNIGLNWTFVSAMTRIINIIIESYFTVDLVTTDITLNISFTEIIVNKKNLDSDSEFIDE